MIRHAVLGKIVGADLFAPFSGADLGFALVVVFGFFLGDFPIEQARAEHGQGARFVLLLGALVGATHDEAGGLVQDLHGGVGGVHPLAAGTAGPADRDLEFLGFNFDVHFLGLGQDGDGGGAGVNASLGLGGGHALHAMNTTLVFEAFIEVGADDREHHFLVAAEVRRAGIERFDFPSLGFRVAGIHAIEI